MSVESLTISDAVTEARTPGRSKPRPLAVVPACPEPPGPRSVALALAKFGLVGGTDSMPRVLGTDSPVLRVALRSLIAEGALAKDPVLSIYRPTALGLDLLGPDLRQRPFLTTR